MTTTMEDYENGKELEEQDIVILFHIVVFNYSYYYKGYPFRNKRMTKTFKNYMKMNNYNRLLSWAENKEEELNKNKVNK